MGSKYTRLNIHEYVRILNMHECAKIYLNVGKYISMCLTLCNMSVSLKYNVKDSLKVTLEV